MSIQNNHHNQFSSNISNLHFYTQEQRQREQRLMQEQQKQESDSNSTTGERQKVHLPGIDKLFPEFTSSANSSPGETQDFIQAPQPISPRSGNLQQQHPMGNQLMPQIYQHPITMHQPQPIPLNSISPNPLPVGIYISPPAQEAQLASQQMFRASSYPTLHQQQHQLQQQQPPLFQAPFPHHQRQPQPQSQPQPQQPQYQVLTTNFNSPTSPQSHSSSVSSSSSQSYPLSNPASASTMFSMTASAVSTKNSNMENRFKCDQCPKSYTRKHNLISHKLSVHEREKLFRCSDCSVKFSRSSDLSRHAKEQHSACIKPFICGGINENDGTRWGCGKRFYRKDQLKSHLSTNKAESKCLRPNDGSVSPELEPVVDGSPSSDNNNRTDLSDQLRLQNSENKGPLTFPVYYDIPKY
ncbi:hypothetical protein CANARDRAFT_27975 [[Candida] arabinofermentans NRRL YB-2248]|uniref:C2H2-type domain-containing protein n=1 Tax=[Candida] arabinofermentans NRRL YB-2248 TaxID=983967 RepID=A0A1E4T2F5_9ASCO|nr:hypothetical protein CANARDRAFT_27975 [[Candida] arabinofermentans NRRL YB-2248]